MGSASAGQVWLAAAAIGLIAAVSMLPSLDSPGSELDEGVLVAYPTMVLDGEVPGRDFGTVAGPGEPYLVAGAFGVLGTSVDAERVVGLAFRITIVLALFFLVLPWGLVAAAGSALISLLIALPLPPSALPLFDAIALGLTAIALAAAALRRAETGRSTAAIATLGGVAAGLALAFRPDLLPAMALGMAPFIVSLAGSIRLWLLGGMALGAVPIVAWLGAIGLDGLERLVDDVRASRPGRRLPLPGPDSLEGQALVASGLGIIGALGAGLLGRARERGTRPTTLVALGLFALGLVPATVQRADREHLLPLACVAAALIPALVVEAHDAWRRPRDASGRLIGGLAAGASLFGLVVAGRAGGPVLRDDVTGNRGPGFDVSVGDRSFPIVDRAAAADLNELLPRLERAARQGDTLFVGTQDLTRTNFNDTFVYYLLDDLRHGSYFTEFNPGTANDPASGLAGELASTDYLLLTSRYDDWDEPNASDERGSIEPNRVVARDFVPVASAGSYELLRRRSG